MLDLIQWRARKTPEQPALFFNGRWYSFRELDGRALRLSNRLADLGVKRGDRVGVLANNHAVHVDLLLAAPKLGFVVVAFNIQCEAATVEAAIRTAQPAMLFCDSRQQALAERSGIPWTRLSDYREWLAVASTSQYVLPDLGTDDPLLLLHTAEGLAELPYRQLLLNARHSADTWKITGDDGTVFCLPCHGPAFPALCLPLLYRGGRIALMSRFDADELIGQIALHRSSFLALDGAMLGRLASHVDFAEADLSSLRWVASLDAPARPAVRQAFRQLGLSVRLLLPGVVAGPNLFDAAESDDALALGQPLPETELRLDGNTLAASGKMVFNGYYGRDTAPGSAVNTGLAVERREGEPYRWLGLAADAVAGAATPVHPLELETALLDLRGVADAAVWPHPQVDGTPALIATVVLSEGARLDIGAFRNLCAQYAPGVPVQQQTARYIPRDAWGRVHRAGVQPVD